MMGILDFYRTEFEKHLKAFPLPAPDPDFTLGTIVEKSDNGFYEKVNHLSSFGIEEDTSDTPDFIGSNIKFSSDSINVKLREGESVIQYAKEKGLNIEANVSVSISSEENYGIYCEVNNLTQLSTQNFGQIRENAKTLYRHDNWNRDYRIVTRLLLAKDFTLIGASAKKSNFDLFSKLEASVNGSPLNVALSGNILSKTSEGMSLEFNREDGVIGYKLVKIKKRFLRRPTVTPNIPGIKSRSVDDVYPDEYLIDAEEIIPGME